MYYVQYDKVGLTPFCCSGPHICPLYCRPLQLLMWRPDLSHRGENLTALSSLSLTGMKLVKSSVTFISPYSGQRAGAQGRLASGRSGRTYSQNDWVRFSDFSPYLQWLFACNATFGVCFGSWSRDNCHGFFFFRPRCVVLAVALWDLIWPLY